jgi:hypothetical protein
MLPGPETLVRGSRKFPIASPHATQGGFAGTTLRPLFLPTPEVASIRNELHRLWIRSQKGRSPGSRSFSLASKLVTALRRSEGVSKPRSTEPPRVNRRDVISGWRSAPPSPLRDTTGYLGVTDQMVMAVTGLGAAGPWWAAPTSVTQVRSDSALRRSKRADHLVAHGHCVGR